MTCRWNQAALLALLAACGSEPPVGDCGDALAGIWAGDGQRFHVLDRGASLEVYPMDGEAGLLPDGVRQSPPAFELGRAPAGITGRRFLRRERDGHICHVDLPAEIRACGDNRLTLAWRELVHVRPVDCKVTLAPRWTEVVLERERHTPRR